MLLTRSFKISDSAGVNELLTKYRLASGAHILVTDGQILIPYEDGAPPNKAQLMIAIGEDRNKVLEELRLMHHSNKVMAHLVADAQDRVNVARANHEAATANPVRKELAAKLAETENALNQTLNQVKMNDHEIVRLKLNIDLFDAAVAKLESN